MATQDNDSGLLSKVAKFVLNPTVDWGDIDKPEAPRSVDNSKQALKEMIERKQHNDSVRKREFDKLRKLRIKPTEPAAGVAVSISAFQDSWGYSVYEERANTLKKIDEIEAQMSKQWWKGRDPSSGQPDSPAVAHQGMTNAYATTLPSDLLDDEEDNVPTRMGATVAHVAAPAPPAAVVKQAVMPEPVVPAAPPSWATSAQEAVEKSLDPADPELEEAAIRFANSDDAGAEAVLLAALQTPDAPLELTKTWVIALLDIYHATDQQASYESVSMDYVQRFNASAPIWVPHRSYAKSAKAAANRVVQPLAKAPGQVFWQSPATLDVTDMKILQTLGQRPGELWCLDWKLLKTATTEASMLLATLLARWCEQPVRLCLPGVESLEHLLQLQTPMADSDVPQFWWQMRLDLIRMRQQQDDFELVALDFCVTYEISPPSWQPAICQIVPDMAASAMPKMTELAPVTSSSMLAPFDVSGSGPLVLTGEILGDATESLDALQAAATAGHDLIISCTNLIRMDFSAAGSMLNWLANAQTNGVKVELRNVSRLVAAFLHLIGINEHARIIHRIY